MRAETSITTYWHVDLHCCAPMVSIQIKQQSNPCYKAIYASISLVFDRVIHKMSFFVTSTGSQYE